MNFSSLHQNPLVENIGHKKELKNKNKNKIIIKRNEREKARMKNVKKETIEDKGGIILYK